MKVRDETKVDQPRFFQARDDFDRPSCCRTDPLEESLRVSRVSKGCRRHNPNRVGPEPLYCAMESAQDFHGFRHRLRREEVAAKYAFAEASDLAIFMDCLKFSAAQSRDFQPD